jgi:hypothetical protein
MEDIVQNPINQSTDLLQSLAKEHHVPLEIAKQMVVLMEKYPDLTPWGSKSELITQLEKIVDSAFNDKIIGME